MEEIKVLEGQSKDLILRANALEVKDEPTSKSATDLGVTISKFLKLAEEKRKFLIQPAQETVKRVNNEFKQFTEPLTQVLDLIREKQRTYLVIQQKKKETEEKEKAEMLEDITGEEVSAGKVKTQIHSQAGMSYLKKRWAFRILDKSKIPDNYKLIDEVKIRQAIRDNTVTISGKTSMNLKIEGVEFYMEDEVAFR
jgi:hypothetical protein